MLGIQEASQGPYGPMSRTHTAPPSTHQRLNSTGAGMQNHHSQYSNASQSSFGYRSSTSTSTTTTTTATSSTTLFTPPPAGGPIEAANNVLNRRGDKEASLFQICLNLQLRLRLVPGFEHYLQEEEEAADDDTDPVTVLWRTFRRGYPLMTIYNAMSPRKVLEINESKVGEKKRGQAASFMFLRACVEELKFPAEECFILTDLYGDDTTGFVKVKFFLSFFPFFPFSLFLVLVQLALLS